jgi:penicillin-binding protein 1A
MLNSALVSGTGRRAALLLHPACGKTGTAQEFRDAWFIGYTAHYVGGVWVGNDDRHAMNRVMGGNLPARLWHDIMVLAHEGRIPTALPGTAPTAPLATALPSQPVAGRPSDDRPILPLERIEPAFVDRVLGKDDTQPGIQPTGKAPGTQSTWIGRTTAALRRWFGG